MKDCRVLILLLITIIALMPIAALASDISSALRRGDIRVTNSGNTTATDAIATANFSSQGLIDNDFTSANLSDVAVQYNGVDVAFMPGVGSNPWAFFVDSIGAGLNIVYDFFTGGASGGTIRYFPGDNGMAVADHTTLELGNNFIVEQKGWVDTDNGSNKNLLFKQEAFTTFISNATNITSGFFSTTKSIYYDTNDDGDQTANATRWLSQTFTTLDAINVWKIEVKIFKVGAPTGNVTASIRTTSAGEPIAGNNSVDLAYVNVDKSTLATTPGGFIEFIFSNPIPLDAATQYAITYHGDVATEDSEWREDASSPTYTGGYRWLSTDTGATWSGNAGVDCMFRVFILDPTVTASGISSSNMTVTTRQTTNLLLNGDFEDGGTPPTGWTLVGAGASSDTDTTTKRINASSANLTRAGVDCHIYQLVTDFASYKGKDMTCGAWIRASQTGVDLAIFDGVGASAGTTHSGGSDWEWLVVNHTMDSNATKLDIRCRVGINQTAYFDGAVLVEGSDFEDFEGNMLSNWSFELGDPLDDWTLGGAGASVNRTNNIAKINTYSANLTRGGANCDLYQEAPSYLQYATKEVTLGIWVWASVADRGRVGINDGVNPTTWGAYHNGNSLWQWFTVSHTLAAVPSRLRTYCVVNTSDTSVFFDGAILVEGSTTPLDVTKRIDHLQILVDDTWYDSSGNVTVPDNSENWTFLQNNVMPYMEYTEVTINGTQAGYWEWEYAVTFSDQSANSNTATPTFRTTSSDNLSATLLSFEPTSESKVTTFSLTDAYSIIIADATPVDRMFDDGDYSKLPAEPINAMLDEAGIPRAAWWLPFLFLGICVIGFIVYGATTMTRGPTGKLHEGQIDGSLLIMFIVMEAFLVALGKMGPIPLWPSYLFPIPGFAFILSRKHFAWG